MRLLELWLFVGWGGIGWMLCWADAAASAAQQQKQQQQQHKLEGIRRRFHGLEHSRDVTVFNECGRKVDVVWIDATTGLASDSQTEGQGLAFGASTEINSFVGHTFEIQELPNSKTFQCRSSSEIIGNKPCQTVQFTVSNNEDQEYTVWDNFTVTSRDNKSVALEKAKKTLEECLSSYYSSSSSQVAKKIKTTTTKTSRTEDNGNDGENNSAEDDPLEALTRCMDEKIQQVLKETQEEIEFQASIRKDMGRYLTHYACRDSNATTTPSISNLTWPYYDPTTRETHDFILQTLFETAESGAWLVEDFISVDQCEALQSYGDSVPAWAIQQSTTVIRLMLQIQKLVQAITNISPKFGLDPKHPMLTLLQRHGTTTATERMPKKEKKEEQQETCSESSSSDSNDSECRVNTDRNTKDDEGALLWMEQHWVPDGAWGTLILVCPPSSSSSSSQSLWSSMSSNGRRRRGGGSGRREPGGGLHFPHTGVHISASQATGSIVWITHHTHDHHPDPYMAEFSVCLPSSPEQSLAVWMDHLTL